MLIGGASISNIEPVYHQHFKHMAIGMASIEGQRNGLPYSFYHRQGSYDFLKRVDIVGRVLTRYHSLFSFGEVSLAENTGHNSCITAT
jgi:hypothetical protein